MAAYDSQKGFTIVELAISLTVIGLLLGGILKGQELIGNSQAVQIVKQIQGYRSAITTFKDTYQKLPGDMPDAADKLPDCTSDCATPGNDDDTITTYGFTTLANAITAGSEQRNFWLHLAKANLIGGIDTTGAASPAPFAFGYELPASPIKGTGYLVSGNTIITTTTAATMTGGGGAIPLYSPQAAYIDRKMDDGKPFMGMVNVIVIANSCYTGTIYSPAANYWDAGKGACFLSFDFRQP